MTKKLRYSLLLLVMFVSCQKVNDYYTDFENSNREKISIGKIKGLEIFCSAIKRDEYLSIILDIKRTDNSIDINDVVLIVDALENPKLEKKEFFKQSGERYIFSDFNEIKDYLNELYKILTPIYYSFEDSRVLKIDDLNFKILVKTNSGVYVRNVRMKKHARYRFFLEGG